MAEARGELGAGGLSGYAVVFDTDVTGDADRGDDTVSVVSTASWTVLDTTETQIVCDDNGRIEKIVPRQLNGKAFLRVQPGGLKWRLQCPWPDPVALAERERDIRPSSATNVTYNNAPAPEA